MTATAIHRQNTSNGGNPTIGGVGAKFSVVTLQLPIKFGQHDAWFNGDGLSVGRYDTPHCK